MDLLAVVLCDVCSQQPFVLGFSSLIKCSYSLIPEAILESLETVGYYLNGNNNSNVDVINLWSLENAFSLIYLHLYLRFAEMFYLKYFVCMRV